MTTVKKSIRFLTVLALVLAMMISIAFVPVSAESAETWNYGTKTQPTINISGRYDTPVKTMGGSGTLTITANFVPRVAFTQVRYTVQLRDVLYGNVVTYNSTSSALAYCPVTITQGVGIHSQFTITFMAFDATTGAPVDAGVIYTYSLKG